MFGGMTPTAQSVSIIAHLVLKEKPIFYRWPRKFTVGINRVEIPLDRF